MTYTAKLTQVATGLLTSCNKLDQQADNRMRSHGLRQLVEDNSFDYRSTIETCCPQASCKLFQQVVTRLQVTNGNKPDFNTDLSVQLDGIDKTSKFDKMRQVLRFLLCILFSPEHWAIMKSFTFEIDLSDVWQNVV